jgi:hypothetical protein
MIRQPESAIDLRPIDTDAGKALFAEWRAKEDRTIY